MKRRWIPGQRTLRRSSEIKVNQIINQEESDEEDVEQNENNDELIIKEKKDNKVNKDNIINNNNDKNIDILGMEKFPPDDYLVGNPQMNNIEVSDIDLDDEEESEKGDYIEKS